MVWIQSASQKGDPVCDSPDPLLFELQPQRSRQEFPQSRAYVFQIELNLPPNYQVVHVTHGLHSRFLCLLLDEAVELTQIKICKMLAGQVADWQSTVTRDFVRPGNALHQSQQSSILEDTSQTLQKRIMRHGVEIFADIQLEIPVILNPAVGNSSRG